MSGTPHQVKRAHLFAAVLLLFHAALVAWSAARHSPTNDEVGHLPAGISHWYFGRFDLFRVNPPLVRMLAALPVVLARPETDWSAVYAGPRPEWSVGSNFMSANGARSFWYFTLARWVCIPLSLVGGYVCFRWASELYGQVSGILAVTLWCFCPNIIAHAQMITTEAGATALGVAAAYLFWRWLRQPRWSWALAAGGLLGLTELTKTTWVVLFPLWPFLWIVYRWPERHGLSWPSGLRQAGQLAVILLFSLYIINLGYGFEGSFQRLGDFKFVSTTLAGPGDDRSWSIVKAHGNRFANGWLATIPIPLPRNYLLGIDIVKHEFEEKQLSYLRGEWRSGGWWYYYLYALTIKVPLGTWVLILGALSVSLFRKCYPVHWREEVVLLMPAVVVLTLVSSQTGFNHHLRYVLPIFPFAYIWTSKIGQVVNRKERALVLASATALLWSIGSSLSVYPHSLSYFNELVGGPKGGHAHLLSSNIDWGQDVLYLKRWLDEHPEARPLGLAYDGNGANLRIAGIEFFRPSPGTVLDGEASKVAENVLGPKPGWYAISVNELRDHRMEYAYFLRFRPVAMAGYSIYIYQVSLEEANGVRRELGMAELSQP